MADRPPSDEFDATRSFDDSQAPRPGAQAGMPEVIDGYRILRLIGEGGMGMVFEAEQQEPRRKVALKVLRGSAHTDELHLRLFRREVETLARLRHPNIAAIYGSGRLPDGRPYFAMELVEGQPLDQYLARRPSPSSREELEHRLAILRKLGAAVHYAHQRGVIHRDLKPSNVLVTEGFATGSSASGAPPVDIKVLDFGLARLTDEDQAATMMSDAGTIRGTLPYMSPEQARGDVGEIDVRSDVYALGVMLYEMITGSRPYDLQRAALAEAVRVICEQPPRPMRDTVSGVHRVDDDLQIIVMKALAKEAERRYASAAALAEDLDRYLTSQPILARPPSAAYQLGKLVERNRPLVAAVAIVLAVVVAASVVSTTLYFRARTEARKASQSAAFMAEMLTGVSPSIALGRDAAMLREILERTAKRVSTELSGQPEVAAEIQQVMGSTYLQLGELDEAEKQLTAALATHRRRGPQAEVADDLRLLGGIEWGRGNTVKAESLLSEALAIRRRLAKQPDAETAEVLSDLGNVFAEAGKPDEAEAPLREALAVRQRLLGGDHELVAVSLNSLASFEHYRGEFETADSLYRLALAMHRRLLGELHPHIGIDLVNLGSLETDRGNFAAADSLIQQGLAQFREVHAGDHPDIANTLNSLGHAKRRMGDWAGAEALFREQLAMSQRIHGERSVPVSEALNALSLVVSEREGPAAALDLNREALAIQREKLPANHRTIVTAVGNLAFQLNALGQYDEADSLYREALTSALAFQSPDHPSYLQIRNNYGRLLAATGRLREAETLFRDVIEKRRRVLGEMNDQVGVSMSDLGGTQRSLGLLAEAEATYGRSLAILDSSLGPQHPATIVTHGVHGRALCDLGRCAEALPEIQTSYEALVGVYGPSHPRVVLAGITLARALAATGATRQAESLLRTAIDSPPAVLPPVQRGEARLEYGRLLDATGRRPAAEREWLAAEKELSTLGPIGSRLHVLVLDSLSSLYASSGRTGEAARWRAVRERAGKGIA